jgi:uncharacterized protein YggE
MKTWRQAMTLGAMLVFATAAAGADEQGTVTVSGHATTPEKAEIIRLTMMVTADGTDVRDAAAKLKQQRDDLKSKLAATGATDGTIKFSDPVEGNQGNLTPQQRMMQQVMAAQNRRAPSTQPTGVTISSTLTAEWPLTDASADDALLAASQLEAKIKDALPKAGVATAKTPEEEEIAQEMAAQQNGAETSKPGEPKFTFVHKLTAEERTRLLKQAFANAQAQAGQIAGAAGLQVGPVVRLSNSKAEAENPENAYFQAIMEAQTGDTTVPAAEDEAQSDQRNGISYTATLTVTFKLQ